jgi:long-chain acyl-CoA synthetase
MPVMTLPDLVSRQARENSKAVAMVFRDEFITYGALEEKILRVTTGLEKRGIKKGDTFAVILRNSPEFVILAMALSKLGAILVPVNFLEKPDRVALILKDAGAVGVLTAKEFYGCLATAAKQVPTLKHQFLREGTYKDALDFSELYKEAPWIGKNQAVASDLMMLLYTSGTTGLPKGVMLTHNNFISNVAQCLGAISLRREDRFLCLLPMFHSFSWTTCVLIPLYLGARIVIIESLLPFDPVIKTIWKHKVTLFVAVPQIFSAITSKIRGAKALFVRFLNPVRLCISGAAPLPPAVHKAFEKNMGMPLIEGYGSTVGKPLPGVAVEIRDDDGRPVPQGEVGEIHIKGDNVMSGYYNKPDETALTLTSDGWLKSGDMGKFDEDGYLSIVDRKKDLIIIKGLNVYPLEIENVLAKNDAVNEVAVVGKMDPDTGEEQIRAFVTAKEGQTVDKVALAALCREHLAGYKRPKEIIVIEQMPKNALQKILKKDLRQR